jgi:nucleotide-binding universal stress UspA family protein
MRSWPGKKILVPVDLHDYAVADVREAIDVVRAFAATAVLVYVIPAVRFPPWLKLDQRGHERNRLEAAKTQLEKLAQTVGGGGECRVVIGDPADQIAACAADVRADLIVLTLKRASVPFAPRQGTITYRVLSTEVAPILTLPQKPRRHAKR